MLSKKFVSKGGLFSFFVRSMFYLSDVKVHIMYIYKFFICVILRLSLSLFQFSLKDSPLEKWFILLPLCTWIVGLVTNF